MYRDRVREIFESPAGRYEQEVIFGRVRPKHPCLEAFVTWEELLGFLRNRESDRDRQDELLFALVHDVHVDPRTGAMTLLNVAMLPMQDHIYGERLKFCHTPDERDELFSKIQGAFGEAVQRYPEHRVHRVASNLQGETYAALRRAWEGEVRLEKARAGIGQAILPLRRAHGDLGEPAPTSFFQLIGTRSAPSDLPPDYTDAERSLDSMAPWLDPDERKLLLEVEAKGRGIREVAAEVGLKHEAAKKRLQRARAKILRAWPDGWRGEGSDESDDLSPD